MVPSGIEDYPASVADLWARVDSLDREDGVWGMSELAKTFPATEGTAAFELAGMHDSMGFEA